MYDESRAEEYWSKRLRDTDALSAVLSYSLPRYVNEAYSTWEISCVLGGIEDWKSLRVIDLGCGVGRVTVPVARAGATVIAFDNSRQMLEACRANVDKAGLADRVEFRHGSARRLTAEDGEFDVVLCLGVLEHLPPDVRSEAMSEIVRVVKPHGTVMVVANSATSVFLAREKRYASAGQEPSGYHVSLIGLETVRSYFEERDFVVDNLGSNLFQSLAKHVLKGFLPIETGEAALTSLLDFCANLDLSFRDKGDLDVAFADQYVIRARRR